MFEDESRNSMKAVTHGAVSNFYLFDALLFDLSKAVETSRYNICNCHFDQYSYLQFDF